MDEGSEGVTLQEVALGRRPADLVIPGGILLNVHTGEMLEGWGVAVAAGRIAAVGPDVETLAGPETEVIDAAGRFLLPGLIDSHTHLDSLTSLPQFLAAAVPGGLTTIITEVTYLATAGGDAGVRALLPLLEQLPITVYVTAPTISFLCSDRGDGEPRITEEEMMRLLEHPRVIGLGEIYWSPLLSGHPGLLRLIAAARCLGKSAEGHAAGARGMKLQAVTALGVSSCHEAITAEEIRERLRLGLSTMVREGSVRQDLAAIEPLLTRGLDFRHLILVTDTVWPPDLRDRGYIDHVVREAIRIGLDPIAAVQAATLNPAEHFGLSQKIGSIAPGRQADLLVVSDLPTLRCDYVLSRGVVVARRGEYLPPRGEEAWLSRQALPGVHLRAPVCPEDFRIIAPAGRGEVSVRVIEIAGEIVTKEQRLSLAPVRGEIRSAPDHGLLKVAALDRFGKGLRTVGLVQGYGLRTGAVASTLSFDTGNIIVVGADEADMAWAVNRVAELGGGVVCAEGGRSLAEIPLPVGGILSEEPVDALADAMAAMEKALGRCGSTLPHPLLTLHTLTFTAIPALRIRERGLYAVREGRRVNAVIEE